MPRKKKEEAVTATEPQTPPGEGAELHESVSPPQEETPPMETPSADVPPADTPEPPADPPPEKPKEGKTVKPRKVAKKGISTGQVARAAKAGPLPDDTKGSERRAFYSLDFKGLDKSLSPDERIEWNAIYASYRAGSILTGRVTGVDAIEVGDVSVLCLVVMDYRVKVLIPYTEVWGNDTEKRSEYILRNFLGAEIEYVIKNVDREGSCAVASRKDAVLFRQYEFGKHKPKVGEIVDCRILVVSPTKMLLEYGGYETLLSQKDISYSVVLNLREDYQTGQTVNAVFKGFEDGRIRLSIKEVNPHPFDGIETRHPLRCRRVSRIMGKYAGGVFCELEKGLSCLCIYSKGQKDSDFDPGDKVIIVVTKYNFADKLVYGRIISAW